MRYIRKKDDAVEVELYNGIIIKIDVYRDIQEILYCIINHDVVLKEGSNEEFLHRFQINKKYVKTLNDKKDFILLDLVEKYS